MARLLVQKTLKMYVGGRFIRSESGRTMPTEASDGTTVNACRGSRKDLRDAVGIARTAQPAWASRTAYNRGQILYRLAEMLEGRRTSLPASTADIDAAVDCAVYYAGWSDKITAVLSSLNPVAATYVNYSRIRPMGVVVAAPAAQDGLLGLVDAACAISVMSNAGVLLVPIASAELS